MNKIEFYVDLNCDFNVLMVGEISFLVMFVNISVLLYECFIDINWVGFYLFEDDILVFGLF